MEITVSPDDYQRIAKTISSDDSPVGIDAKKTHIIIIQKLLSIERRLERMEAELASANKTTAAVPSSGREAPSVSLPK
jgi:hypothetical protein